MIREEVWWLTGCVVFLVIPVALAQSGGGYDLTWNTIDGGGGTSAGGGFELSGTIGQPDASAANMTGDIFALTGGFWAGAGVGPAGDCDNDGDVDLDDYVDFANCLAGPAGGTDPVCECFDLDGDGDVTLADFAEFQAAWTN